MRRLDINLLLALTDPMHVHYELSHQWFAKKGQKGWATCPLTENGLVRIASHPKYPNRQGNVRAVCSILDQICKSPGHHFWTEDLSILDILEPGAIITHAQITVYSFELLSFCLGKLVRDIIFIDIRNVLHRFPANLFSGNHLDVLKPDIGIEPLFLCLRP